MQKISQTTWRMSDIEWKEIKAQGYLKHGDILVEAWRLCAVQYASKRWEIYICKP